MFSPSVWFLWWYHHIRTSRAIMSVLLQGLVRYNGCFLFATEHVCLAPGLCNGPPTGMPRAILLFDTKSIKYEVPWYASHIAILICLKKNSDPYWQSRIIFPFIGLSPVHNKERSLRSFTNRFAFLLRKQNKNVRVHPCP